ncbi:MAG: hypothetical protein WKG52_10595 [Variovorax sp.]
MRTETDRSTPSAPASSGPSSDVPGWADLIDSYELALGAVERDYPVLNPDSADFREELMLEVYEAMKLLVKQGTAPALAVELAALQTAGRLRPH